MAADAPACDSETGRARVPAERRPLLTGPAARARRPARVGRPRTGRGACGCAGRARHMRLRGKNPAHAAAWEEPDPCRSAAGTGPMRQRRMSGLFEPAGGGLGRRRGRFGDHRLESRHRCRATEGASPPLRMESATIFESERRGGSLLASDRRGSSLAGFPCHAAPCPEPIDGRTLPARRIRLLGIASPSATRSAPTSAEGHDATQTKKPAGQARRVSDC